MSKSKKKNFPGVMISSTFNDLVEHRNVLHQALSKQDLHPVEMESHIPRTDDNIISSSLSMVEKSTAYIGLISRRYGQVIEDEKLNPNGYSVTRLEYEKAKELGLPTLIFIMHEDHLVRSRDVETDNEKKIKLEEFREEAKKGRLYFEFIDMDEFSTESIHRIAQLKREIEEENQNNVERPQKRIDIDENSIISPPRLFAQPPYIGSHKFVGRKAELEQLDDWSSSSDPHPVLLYEAIGGSGKSMLTWEWTKNHSSNNRDDWEGKFWYSFYERGAQMSDFCRHALAYITGKTIKDFIKKKTPEMSHILLSHLRNKPYLFILDGLERVLVAYNRIDAAEIRDEELENPTDQIIDRDPRAAIRPEDDDLIHALASANPSKILVSSRLIPKVLINPSSQAITGVQRSTLTGLRPKDAELLFLSCGVHGDSKKIQSYISEHCACHPLVTGVLAGLVIDYLPNKGNFDAWVKDSELGGGKLNLNDLDLVQKRNHILTIALKNLSAESIKLLSTLSFLTDSIDYETLYSLNPYLKENSSQSKSAQKLQSIVKELELRGFIQFDGRYHNLHPVVRGVVSGGLESNEKQEYGQIVIDHFTQKSILLNYDDAEILEDLKEVIFIIATLLKMGKYHDAFNLYRGGISNVLYYNLEAHNESLALLKPFFPNSWFKIPSTINEQDRSYLINNISVLYSTFQRFEIAIKLSYERLNIELKLQNWFEIETSISNLAKYFRDIGKLYKQKKYLNWSIEISKLTGYKSSLFTSRLNYYSYLITIGAYPKAETEWKNLSVQNDSNFAREKYRIGGLEKEHCEYNFRLDQLNESYLEKSILKAKEAKNRVVYRSLLFLKATIKKNQNKWNEVVPILQKTIEMARSVGKNDYASETLLTITKLKLNQIKNPKTVANQLSESSNQEYLLLAELWDVLEDLENTKKFALKAYQKYWSDGEPYVDRFNLEQTKKFLDKIGTPYPDLPIYKASKEEIHPVELKLIKAIEELRKEKETERENKD